MIDAPAAGFTGLVDLAAEALGGRALGSSDEFFAASGNLIKPGRGTFIEGKYTDRGKWMDGWESRRRRRPGHDWCVLELGAPGRVLGFDIDTHHFVGNSPSFASVDGVYAPRPTSLEELTKLSWIELLGESPLRPGSQNLFAATPAEPMTHLRLNIFPDGGVARFRAFGRVHPVWEPADLDEETRAHVSPGSFDLAAVKNGGLALACSDAFFGPMNNLLLPGRAVDMGGGWETRRRRGPGHDWIVVRLGARGTTRCVEIDTQHFLGNCPERCSIEWIDSPDARITDLLASDGWATLLDPTTLRPSTRHFFDTLTAPAMAASHLRLNVFPDGGVSRLRVWGSPRCADAHAVLNASTRDEAAALLRRCCGSSRWVEGLLDRRPFASRAALDSAADDLWARMTRDDYLEALRQHPRIGGLDERVAESGGPAADWSREEQAAASSADDGTLQALRRANATYEERFGFVFLVCATGRRADELLRALEARLNNDPETELRVAAGELAKIARLRLEKIAR